MAFHNDTNMSELWRDGFTHVRDFLGSEAGALENEETRPKIYIYYWKVCFSYAKSKVEVREQEAAGNTACGWHRPAKQCRDHPKGPGPKTPLNGIGALAIRTVSTTHDLDNMVYCSVGQVPLTSYSFGT